MKLVSCSDIKVKADNELGRWSPAISTESGAALIICVLILTAVTILGVVGIHAGVVDLQIATNHTQMGHGLYLAEGAALEGVQRLANAPTIDLQDRSFFWHHSRSALEAANLDLRCSAHWSDIGNPQKIVLESGLGVNTHLAAVEWSLAAGSSMVATESRLYLNRVYGKSTRFQADHLVEIGFQMRY
jgi:Tfp pilus assembly protein PilX